LSEVSLLLAERAERFFQKDIVFKLLENVKDETTINLFKKNFQAFAQQKIEFNVSS